MTGLGGAGLMFWYVSVDRPKVASHFVDALPPLLLICSQVLLGHQAGSEGRFLGRRFGHRPVDACRPGKERQSSSDGGRDYRSPNMLTFSLSFCSDRLPAPGSRLAPRRTSPPPRSKESLWFSRHAGVSVCFPSSLKPHVASSTTHNSHAPSSHSTVCHCFPRLIRCRV
jgi:hypothetical protein